MSSTDTHTAVSRILTEDVLTLTQARAEIAEATGRRVEKSTICRWIHRGVGGTHLDAARVGNSLLTSRQALTRFIESRTAKSIGSQPLSRGAGR